MKKILKYISLLAGVAFLTAACSQSDIDGNASEEMGTLRLSVNIGGSRADAYNALDRSIMRVYKIENGEEKLIRKYQPATEAPGDFYLVAGSYRIKVEAGDQSQATFTNKSYYGELDVDIEPQQTVLKEVVCPTTNIGVKVVFDQTILDKMDPGFKAYVSAIDTFSKTEAENGSVPTLKYTENATGYYLLPEDVHNLSWGFYSSSTELGSVSKTGVIPTPESGNLYTLTFKYSKTPNGYLGITVQVDQDGEIHEDPFIFSPQPTIKGDGFDINSVIGFNTDDISFAVSSVQALSGISIKANDETIQVLSDGALLPEAAAKGISYTKTDDNSGKLSLGGTFFSTFAGGIHEVEFTMTDVAQAEGTGKARIATPGLTDLAVYDLWLNTADFQVIVTEPADDPRPGSTGSKSALLKTQSAFGVIAAGNLFIGAFGGVHNITKGDVYMGRPFTFNARPKAITFWYKGTVGSGDKARFFVCMGKWSSYHKIDTNDQSTFFDPSQESLPEGPIYGHGDWLNDTSQSDWKKIVIPIKYRSDEKPNYLMVTASASYRGDYMEGNKESRMYIDDIEFVY